MIISEKCGIHLAGSVVKIEKRWNVIRLHLVSACYVWQVVRQYYDCWWLLITVVEKQWTNLKYHITSGSDSHNFLFHQISSLQLFIFNSWNRVPLSFNGFKRKFYTFFCSSVNGKRNSSDLSFEIIVHSRWCLYFHLLRRSWYFFWCEIPYFYSKPRLRNSGCRNIISRGIFHTTWVQERHDSFIVSTVFPSEWTTRDRRGSEWEALGET